MLVNVYFQNRHFHLSSVECKCFFTHYVNELYFHSLYFHVCVGNKDWQSHIYPFSHAHTLSIPAMPPCLVPLFSNIPKAHYIILDKLRSIQCSLNAALLLKPLHQPIICNATGQQYYPRKTYSDKITLPSTMPLSNNNLQENQLAQVK